MKRFQLLLTACLLLMATTASAQFSNTGGSGSKSKSGSVLSMDTESYNRIYVGYSPFNAKCSDNNYKDLKMNGFTAGYLHGFSLSEKLPLFLEVGGNIQYFMGKVDSEIEHYDPYYDYDYVEETKSKYSLLSLNIPVNLAYKFSFADNTLGVTPFVGLNFRANLMGKLKSTYSYMEGSESTDCSLFDDSMDKMGDDAWKRFQVGFNAGVNLNYKAFSLGVYYTADFMPISKLKDENKEIKYNVGITTISLGFSF